MIEQLFTAVLLVASSGQAIERPDRTETFSDEYKACAPAGTSNADLSVCQEAELRRQTAKLDDLIAYYRPVLHPHELADLERGQTAWAEETEKQCDDEASELEGAAFGRVYSECRIASIVARIHELDPDVAD